MKLCNDLQSRNFWVKFIKFLYRNLLLLTGTVETKMSQNFLSSLLPKHFISPTWLKCHPLLKMPHFKSCSSISFSFNNAAIFCISTCMCVLINQYLTGLFVGYSVKRKSHKTVRQSAQTRQKKNPISLNNISKTFSGLKRLQTTLPP